MLKGLLSQPGEWQRRDGAFYRCLLRDVTQSVPIDFVYELLPRMRQLTGLPLIDKVAVTAQRMLPGDTIGIHSDRPLLGYEIARLVVQMNPDWRSEYGGVLELFSSPDSEPTVQISPSYNDAFGFILHVGSYHGVTEVTHPRETLVFNFWHSANTPELETYVRSTFAQMHFSELPGELDSLAASAESTLPEETTLLAGTAAIALQRWGYDIATIIEGYSHSAGIQICASPNPEIYAAVLLADWLAFLYRDSFDLSRWYKLQSDLQGLDIIERLITPWQLCLPKFRDSENIWSDKVP